MSTRLCAALLMLVCTSAAAHHSPAMFDEQQRVSLKGTVRQFQWRNPHSYIQLVVQGADGKPVEWSIETAAPMYLQQSGWKPSSLKQGDEITVVVAPLRKQVAGKPGALLIEASRADGSPVGRQSGVPK